jgi:hypothetical protein
LITYALACLLAKAAGQAIIGDKTRTAPRTLALAGAQAMIFPPSVANMRHLTLG